MLPGDNSDSHMLTGIGKSLDHHSRTGRCQRTMDFLPLLLGSLVTADESCVQNHCDSYDRHAIVVSSTHEPYD